VHDVFCNCVAIARFAGRASWLSFESVIQLEHLPANVLDFQIEEYAKRYPFTYGADEMPDLLRAIERQYLDPEHEIEMLAAMTHALRQNLTYVACRARRAAFNTRSGAYDSAAAAAGILPC